VPFFGTGSRIYGAGECLDFQRPLSLPGENFKIETSREIDGSAELTRAAQAFIELGSIRNRIVHQNYAAFIGNKSSEEVFVLFQRAEEFIAFIESKLLPPGVAAA